MVSDCVKTRKKTVDACTSRESLYIQLGGDESAKYFKIHNEAIKLR